MRKFPFPHAVLDDYFPRELLSSCAVEMNAITRWDRTDTPPEKKYSADWLMGGTAIRDYFQRLDSNEFRTLLTLNFDLPADLSFNGYGGGCHRMEVGDHLDSHVDFTRIGPEGLYRRVNVLTFIEAPTEGGELVLSGKADKVIEAKVGRTVIFPTGEKTWHAVKEIKAGRRLSLAGYLFSEEPPADFQGYRSTLFKEP